MNSVTTELNGTRVYEFTVITR